MSLKTIESTNQMNTVDFLTSACRYCRHYAPEGRRGGMCQRLGVPVQANWKACTLASPPFASNWNDLEEITRLEDCLSAEASLSFVEEEQVATAQASLAK